MKPGAPPQASMIQKSLVPGAHNTGLCVDNTAMVFLLLIINCEGSESILSCSYIHDTIKPSQLFSAFYNGVLSYLSELL
jgi:hypothetical protein